MFTVDACGNIWIAREGVPTPCGYYMMLVKGCPYLSEGYSVSHQLTGAQIVQLRDAYAKSMKNDS